MKKLFALALVVVLTFSVVTVASAEKTTWTGGGGDLYFLYRSGDNQPDGAQSYGTYMCLDAIGVQVTGENNTYAKAWVNVDTWRTAKTWASELAWGGGDVTMYYAIGINKIGGTGLSIALNTKDDGYGMGINSGQALLSDNFSDFHTDSALNTNDWPDCVYINYTAGNFTFKSQYRVTPPSTTDEHYELDPESGNIILVPATENKNGNGNYGYKLIYNLGDGQQIYYACKDMTATSGDDDQVLSNIGASLKFGDISLNVDYFMDKNNMVSYGDDACDGPGSAPWNTTSGGGDIFQADVGMKLNDRPLNVIVFYHMPEDDTKSETTGLGVKYGVTDKLTASVKFFSNDDKLYGGEDSAYNLQALYNVGAWDLAVGTIQTDADSNFYVGVHANLW